MATEPWISLEKYRLLVKNAHRGQDIFCLKIKVYHFDRFEMFSSILGLEL